MTHHFKPCETLDELQTAYRRLLLELHPDRHAGETPEQIAEWTRLTQELNREYAIVAAALRMKEESKRRKDSGRPEPTPDDAATWRDVDEAIRQAIERIVFLPRLEIELCGFWVWVSGDTKPVKELLKGAGYKWAPKKERWYFAGIPSSSRGGYDMDDIRARYGSTRYETKEREKVDA